MAPRHLARSLRPLTLLSLLLLAACGSGAAPAGDSLEPAAAGPDALVLQVSRSGGSVLPGAAFSSVPSVSVYGDGRVVTPGAQIEIFPPPALPSVQVGQLPAARLRALLDQGRDVVGGQEDLGRPPVADAPTTVVVVGAGADRQVASAVGLDELAVDEPGGAVPPPDGGLTAQQRAAREQLRAYVRQVQTAASEVEAELYDAPALAVLALPAGEPAAADGTPPDERVWPGPPIEPASSGSSPCVVVTGEQLDAVREAAAQASTETRWTAGSQVWRLAFRPLLPHESSCADALQPPAPPTA